MARSLPILPGHEDGGDAMADFLRHFQESHELPGASGALHLEFVSIVEVVPL